MRRLRRRRGNDRIEKERGREYCAVLVSPIVCARVDGMDLKSYEWQVR